MEEEIRNLLLKCRENIIDEKLVKEIDDLLEKDFEKQVLKIFSYFIRYPSEDMLNNRIKFIGRISGFTDVEKFVSENWDKIDTMMEICAKEIKRIEKNEE